MPRPLARHAFTALSLLSLLLCVAALVIGWEVLDNAQWGVHFWVIMVVTAPWPVIWVVQRTANWRSTSRRARGLCPQCGYDLRASPGRCPECGAGPPAPSV